jgi:hypothetical protein
VSDIIVRMKPKTTTRLLFIIFIYSNQLFAQITDKQREIAIKYINDIERAEKMNNSKNFKQSNLLVDSIISYTSTITFEMWSLQMRNSFELLEDKRIMQIHDWKKKGLLFDNKVNKEKYQLFLASYEPRLVNAITNENRKTLTTVYLHLYENGIQKNEIKNYIDVKIAPNIQQNYEENNEWTVKLVELYNLRFPDSWSKLSIPSALLNRNNQNNTALNSEEVYIDLERKKVSLLDYRSFKSYMGIPFLSFSMNSFMPLGLGLVETYTNKGIGFYSFLKLKPLFYGSTEGITLLNSGGYNDPVSDTYISPNSFVKRELRSGFYGGVGLTAHIYSRFYGYFGIGYGFNKSKTIIEETKYHIASSAVSERGLIFDLGTTIYCNSIFSVKLGMTHFRTVRESYLSTGVMLNL